MEKKASEKKEPLLIEDSLSQYPDVEAAWNKQASPEDRIQMAISFMKETLSQKQAPLFKKFWDLRKMALQIFREDMDPIHRTKLWGEFVALSNEARALKAIFDEKSSFAAEQIALAIESLEKDLASYDALLKNRERIHLDLFEELETHREFYEEKQTELQLIQTFFSRGSSLRKELIHTTMRMKQKNTLFKRLTIASQTISEKRETGTKEVSERFREDVDQFVDKYFSKEHRTPFYALKEKIKLLQLIAKKLFLTSSAFSDIRLKLSSCWDEVKEKERQYKEKVQAKKQQSQEKKGAFLAKIALIKEQKGSLSSNELTKELRNVRQEMKDAKLRREDVEELEELLQNLRGETPIVQPSGAFASVSFIKSFDQKIASLSEEKESIPFEDAYDRFEQIERQIDKAPASYKEKSRLQKSLIPLRQWIDATLENTIEKASKEESLTFSDRREILLLAKKIRMKIKKNLEEERKKKGRSGLDFAMAMAHQERLENEKKRVERIDVSIETLEERLEQIEPN